MKEEGVKKIVSAIVENPTRWNHLTFLSLNNLVMTGLEPALAKALDVLVHLEVSNPHSTCLPRDHPSSWFFHLFLPVVHLLISVLDS